MKTSSKHPSEAPQFTVRQLSFGYPGTLVLKELDFAVQRGERAALIGPSGCGKSTLLHLIAHVLLPPPGTIRLTGEAMLVPQDPGLLPWKTVQANIELGLRIKKRAVSLSELESVWEQCQLRPLLARFPASLSGGQRQRVSLARALVLRPDWLLLDEPFSAIDALTREDLQDLLLQLHATHGFGFLLVTHSIEEAVSLCSRVLVLSQPPCTMLEELSFPTSLERGSMEHFAACQRIRAVLTSNKNLQTG